MAHEVKPVLPAGAGYAVVVGIGFFFAFLMMGVSYVQVRSPSALESPQAAVPNALQNRYTAYSTKSSEEFNAASRNVKAGMIVSIDFIPLRLLMILKTSSDHTAGVWRRECLDLGSNSAPKLDGRVPVRHQRAILV